MIALLQEFLMVLFVVLIVVACAGTTPQAATSVPAATLAPTQAAPATKAATSAPPTIAPQATQVSAPNGAVVVSGAGASADDIRAKVDEYRKLLGDPENDGTPGTQSSGRREINWDTVPDELAAPNNLPSDFFNANAAPRARGAVLTTPGSGVQVSAKSGNPTNTPPRFGNINPQYPNIFKTFSPERLFSPIGSNIVDLEFFVPGTKTPAVVRGFGAVYTDVDQKHTAFEYFDTAGSSLGKFEVPISKNGLSFLGVVFPSPLVHKVRIAYGTTALGPDDGGDVDVAVMDDFIYGEPQAVPGATTAPTSAPSTGGTFVQIGESLNHDKNAAATDQEIAVGSLDATKPGVAWVTWAEKQDKTQQIFVNRQNGNKFEPVGASLNIHQSAVAEHPSIDFTGADRAVPWVAWYEPSPTFDQQDQVFASRFNAKTGLWTPAGKDRQQNEPSLNIHTAKNAVDPVLAGGSTDPTKPTAPWVCWQEESAANKAAAIFVSRAVSDTTGLGGFVWQPVGLNRGGTAQDPEPSLNVDVKAGQSEDCWIAFAETNNAVPWVVWTEQIGSAPKRLYVSRAVADPTALGGFKWQFVPDCPSPAAAADCSQNINPTKEAVDPFMTAGTVLAGQATVPWIVWAEVGPTGKHQIFVDRLDQVSRNKFLNVGGSLNVDQNRDARGPSITFVNNVPFVAWEEETATVKRVFIRHLASDPQTGTWVLDSPKEGLAVDKTRDAIYPILRATPDGKVVFVFHQGDEDKEASQIVVCTNATLTTLLQKLPGVASFAAQAKSCQ